ncbi:MAG: efflux RND transporter periplasmic adaptor subunit [Roseinatronobacter sp.]
MQGFRKLILALIGVALVAALVWALLPQPQQVDLASVTRGPMQGTIVAQGVTRVREPYTIAAPITGSVTRSPVEVGDRVVAGETVVAVIRPADPGLMDARTRAQAEAAVAEAEAALALAQTSLRQAEGELAHAASQLDRSRVMADSGTIPRRMLEDIEVVHERAEQARDAAMAQLDFNRASLIRAQAQLLGPSLIFDPDTEADECCMRIMAPQNGVVLSVSDQSARLVQAGTPLLTIGNLDELEIEVDLLSNDAVNVPPDAMALVERWGGEGVLDARLRRIEPAAFTRVSALGIEEQRVRLRLDLLTPPEGRKGLGDGYRVHLRVILWEETDLVQVPQAALFRQNAGWAVFVYDGGKAGLREVEIGRTASDQAEVLSGLTESDQVVLYPPSSLTDGVSITQRPVQ